MTTQLKPCPRCKGMLAFLRDGDGPYLDCYQCGHHVDLSDSDMEKARRAQAWDDNARKQKALTPEPTLTVTQSVAWLQEHRPGLTNVEMALEIGVSSARVGQIINWESRITHYILHEDKVMALRQSLPYNDWLGKPSLIPREKLARMTGIRPHTLADTEQGRPITAAQAQKLADYYQVSLESLVEREIWSERKQV